MKGRIDGREQTMRIWNIKQQRKMCGESSGCNLEIEYRFIKKYL